MAYQLNPNIKNLTPYQPIHGDFNIRLDANESFYSLDEKIKLSINEALLDLDYNRYPDSNAVELVNTFADFYHINPTNVTAGNGSDELISLIVGTFLSPNQKLLTFSNDFSMYQIYASIYGLETVTYQKNDDLTIDVDKVISLSQDTSIGAIFFSNPCNPTSLLLNRNDVIKLVKGVNCLVVLDEAYMDFCNDDVTGENSLLQSVSKYDNLIILKTSSKAVGLAGIRLGFAIANDTITNALKSVKSPYNVNSITQLVGKITFGDRDLVLSKTKQLVANTKVLQTQLEKIFNLPEEVVYSSKTNFVYVKTNRGKMIFDNLLLNSIAIRYMGDYLRITAGSDTENKTLIATLQKIIKGN